MLSGARQPDRRTGDAAPPLVWVISSQQWPRAYIRGELLELGYEAEGFERIPVRLPVRPILPAEAEGAGGLPREAGPPPREAFSPDGGGRSAGRPAAAQPALVVLDLFGLPRRPGDLRRLCRWLSRAGIPLLLLGGSVDLADEELQAAGLPAAGTAAGTPPSATPPAAAPPPGGGRRAAAQPPSPPPSAVLRRPFSIRDVVEAARRLCPLP